MESISLYSNFICIIVVAFPMQSASDNTKCLYNFNFQDATKEPSCKDYINNKVKGLRNTVAQLEAKIKERKTLSSQGNEKCQKKSYTISFTGMHSHKFTATPNTPNNRSGV